MSARRAPDATSLASIPPACVCAMDPNGAAPRLAADDKTLAEPVRQSEAAVARCDGRSGARRGGD